MQAYLFFAILSCRPTKNKEGVTFTPSVVIMYVIFLYSSNCLFLLSLCCIVFCIFLLMPDFSRSKLRTTDITKKFGGASPPAPPPRCVINHHSHYIVLFVTGSQPTKKNVRLRHIHSHSPPLLHHNNCCRRDQNGWNFSMLNVVYRSVLLYIFYIHLTHTRRR